MRGRMYELMEEAHCAQIYLGASVLKVADEITMKHGVTSDLLRKHGATWKPIKGRCT